jgi:hypothetical protein
MQIDQGEPSFEELRRRMFELTVWLSHRDVAGALDYAIQNARSADDLVLMLAGALEGQAVLAEQKLRQN